MRAIFKNFNPRYQRTIAGANQLPGPVHFDALRNAAAFSSSRHGWPSDNSLSRRRLRCRPQDAMTLITGTAYPSYPGVVSKSS